MLMDCKICLETAQKMKGCFEIVILMVDKYGVEISFRLIGF